MGSVAHESVLIPFRTLLEPQQGQAVSLISFAKAT